MAALDQRPRATALVSISDPLIGGAWQVDFAAELAAAGGGPAAYAVRDRHGGRTEMMAVLTRPEAPVRAHVINQLLPAPVEGVMCPVAQGAATRAGGRAAWFVIAQAPPGPALWQTPFAAIKPWSEADLLDRLLRPAARALELLAERYVTHRSIRPDNLFRAGARDPVVLGSAWSAPPASLQPAIFEPPYAARCLPAGRGEGSIADDVYALGVTLLALALGRLPLPGLDPGEVVRRKLELGSFEALAGGERLSPVIADLVRGMLAEDPEHRPPPALLADPMAARARRVAARPPRRAQQPIELAGQPVWTARTLALAMAEDPEAGCQLLRQGAVDRWIRRGLGDAPLAVRLDEAVRLRAADVDSASQTADALLATRAVAVLDPLAPLSWRGIALWPDGLGAALAAAGTTPGADDPTERLQQIVTTDAISAWASARPERCNSGDLSPDSHQHRTLLRLRGWGGGLPRLRYALNPLLPCRSPLLNGRLVLRLADLLPALEEVAAAGSGPVLDQEVSAFLAARHEQRVEAELIALAEAPTPQAAALVQLRLLAGLQELQPGRPVPALAAGLARQVAPTLDVWRNRDRRARMAAALEALVAPGRLSAMLALIEDPAALHADARELDDARVRIRAIETEIAGLAAQAPQRRDIARRVGQELVAGAGVVALTLAAIGVWLP